MLTDHLTHLFTSDDNDPDIQEFHEVLCEKLDNLTVQASETEEGLQLEYDENNETVMLRWVNVSKPSTPTILPKSEIKSIVLFC